MLVGSFLQITMVRQQRSHFRDERKGFPGAVIFTWNGFVWLTILSTAILLLSAGCAPYGILPSNQLAPAMSASVVEFYNEGARLYRQKDFQRAREEYQAALAQA